MNSFQQLFLICLTLLITACSVESITEEPSNEIEVSQELPSFSKAPDYSNFSVTPAMLTKYLRLVCKGKQVEIVDPIIENGDTLAYYVEFSNDAGWNLIAADTRVTPVLSEAPTGHLVFSEDGPVNGILGILKNVVDTKNNPEASVQAIWKFLCPEVYRVETKGGSKSTRGITVGMWMPVDTVFAYDTVFSGRTIATKWGQDEPWNAYTPESKKPDWANWIHCPVGCAPVAVGQILYRYLYLTNGLYPIPDSVYMQNHLPQFVSFTTDWSGMALDALETDVNAKNKTAKFLSWLGDLMETDYHLNYSKPEYNDVKNILSYYLNYSQTDSYNYYTVLSNVSAHIPVCIFAGRSATDNTGHAFIVDAYKNIKYQARVRYIFDPSHIVTEEEYNTFPQWMFTEPGPGYGYDPDKGEDAWQTVPIDIIDNTYFLMNWGYSGECDDATYLARHKEYFYNPDFSYLYYSTENFPGLYWQVTRQSDTTTYTHLEHMLYNFTRKN